MRELAIALTGWGVDWVDEARVKNPDTCVVSYHKDLHRTGTRHILGATITDDGKSTMLAKVLTRLARHPSTAPFQAKELLQRFVTETPSPRYVQSIARIWVARAGAPDQVSQVMRAMVADREFELAYHQMLKEPIEAFAGALRALPFVLKDAQTDDGAVARGADLVQDGGFLETCGERLYDPPSVFSFYRPGHKSTLFAQHFLAARVAGLGSLSSADAAAPTTNTAIDFDRLGRQIGSDDPHTAALYLINALSDVETSQLLARWKNI